MPIIKIALSGAGGQIGRFLRPALLAKGVDLRSSGGRNIGGKHPLENVGADEDVCYGDLREPAHVDRLLKGVDLFIHMAATSVERPLPEVIENNIVGLNALYEGALRNGVKRFVFASSNHTVGMHPVTDKLELETDFRPDGFYGLSKVWGESLARLYWDKHGMESVCVRIGSALDKPLEFRHLSTWFGNEDLLRFILRCIATPKVGYVVLWGVSNNTRSYWTPVGSKVLGFHPEQNAEDYAAELLLLKNPQSVVGQRFQGGSFASMNFTPDADRLG